MQKPSAEMEKERLTIVCTTNRPRTQDQTWSNCQSQFLGFQGQYTPKVEISGRGVPGRYSTPCIFFTIAPCKISSGSGEKPRNVGAIRPKSNGRILVSPPLRTLPKDLACEESERPLRFSGFEFRAQRLGTRADVSWG